MIDQLPKPSQPPTKSQPIHPEMVYTIDQVADIIQRNRRWILDNMLSDKDGSIPCRHYRLGDTIFIVGDWVRQWCFERSAALEKPQ